MGQYVVCGIERVTGNHRMLGNFPIVILLYADQYFPAPFDRCFVHANFDCLCKHLEHEQSAWRSRRTLTGVCFWFCISIRFA